MVILLINTLKIFIESFYPFFQYLLTLSFASCPTALIFSVIQLYLNLQFSKGDDRLCGGHERWSDFSPVSGTFPGVQGVSEVVLWSSALYSLGACVPLPTWTPLLWARWKWGWGAENHLHIQKTEPHCAPKTGYCTSHSDSTRICCVSRGWPEGKRDALHGFDINLR